MTFVYRGITDKEKSTYDFKAIAEEGGHVFGNTISPSVLGSWIVDESRNAFLYKIAQLPFVDDYLVEYFAFYLRGKTGYLRASKFVKGDSFADAFVTWRDGRLVLHESMEPERSAIEEMIEQALFEYGTGARGGSQIRGVEVAPWQSNFDDLSEEAK